MNSALSASTKESVEGAFQAAAPNIESLIIIQGKSDGGAVSASSDLVGKKLLGIAPNHKLTASWWNGSSWEFAVIGGSFSLSAALGKVMRVEPLR